MTTHDNRLSMQRFYDEVMSNGNTAFIDEACTPDYIEHDDHPNGMNGLEALKREVAMLRTAFPDMRVTIDDMVAEGDRVVARTTIRCTHLGPFMGIPPTGRALQVGGMDIVRFVDGRSAEHWGMVDNMAMMKQLGMIPSGPPPVGS